MIGTVFAGRKPVVVGLLGAAVIAACIVIWRKHRLSELVHIGAGYAAQQTCACVFVGRRELASCLADLEPLAQRVVSVRLGTDEVTAHVLFASKAVARYERGFGCSLRD